MTPRILVALFGLALLAGCDDSSSSNEKPESRERTTCACVQVVDTGTYNSSFLERSGGYAYREQITFTGDGSFEFVDYETSDATGEITSYTKFLGRWSQADSSITLSRTKRIYHTTYTDESNEETPYDPPSPLVLGTKLQVKDRSSFSMIDPDGVRQEYTKAPKIQFAF